MKTLHPFPFSKPLASFLFCAVFLSASLPPLSGLPSDSPAPPPETGSAQSELARLLEISTRLSAINETLRNELENSRRSSTALSGTLETSRRELEQLRAELDGLRTTSTQLLAAARNSESELNGLREALKKAESSLMSLELSWEAYKTAAETRIARLERRAVFYRWSLAAVIVIAASGWAAYGISQ
jgi:chromosome segregation ATPase